MVQTQSPKPVLLLIRLRVFRTTCSTNRGIPYEAILPDKRLSVIIQLMAVCTLSGAKKPQTLKTLKLNRKYDNDYMNEEMNA